MKKLKYYQASNSTGGCVFPGTSSISFKLRLEKGLVGEEKGKGGEESVPRRKFKRCLLLEDSRHLLGWFPVGPAFPEKSLRPPRHLY